MSRSRRRYSRSPASPASISLLGPEMKSTGEVMGLDHDFGGRIRQVPARRRQPVARPGHGVHLGARPRQAGHDRVGRRLLAYGFGLIGTSGTAAHLRAAGIEVLPINKVSRAGRTSSTGSRTARSRWSSTPPKASARSPTATRSGVPLWSIRCRTTRPWPAPARSSRQSSRSPSASLQWLPCNPIIDE